MLLEFISTQNQFCLDIFSAEYYSEFLALAGEWSIYTIRH